VGAGVGLHNKAPGCKDRNHSGSRCTAGTFTDSTGLKTISQIRAGYVKAAHEQPAFSPSSSRSSPSSLDVSIGMCVAPGSYPRSSSSSSSSSSLSVSVGGGYRGGYGIHFQRERAQLGFHRQASIAR
jgi:hypothetical protein